MSADAEKLSNSLQFDSAELPPGSAPGGVACAQCNKPITDFYYEAAGKTFCRSCTTLIKQALDSRFETARFARAALFGLGGAIAGAAVYYGILAATGYEVGLVAILVGFLVGWTVRRGAGRGGRSYQLLAISLTYLAIGATYMSYALKESFGSKTTSGVVADSSSAAGNPSAAKPNDAKPVSTGRVFIALGGLIGLTVAMPVLFLVGGLPGSLISGLIMFFGLRQAWIMNRMPVVNFSGPLRVAAPGTATAGG